VVSDTTDSGNFGDPCNLFEFYSWLKDHNGPLGGGFGGLKRPFQPFVRLD
jgi:hypothetical protein